jgi:hypothetical protein
MLAMTEKIRARVIREVRVTRLDKIKDRIRDKDAVMTRASKVNKDSKEIRMWVIRVDNKVVPMRVVQIRDAAIKIARILPVLKTLQKKLVQKNQDLAVTGNVC